MSELTPFEQFILDNNRAWPFANDEPVLIVDYGSVVASVTKVGFLKRIAEENRPSFEDHPDAKCFACDMTGYWYKSTLTSEVKITGDAWTCEEVGYSEGWGYLQNGNPIGGWCNSLMIRPEEEAEATWVPSVGDVCVTVGGDFTIDYVGKRIVLGHYECGIENNYRISDLVKKEPTERELFISTFIENFEVGCKDFSIGNIYDKGFRYMGDAA